MRAATILRPVSAFALSLIAVSPIAGQSKLDRDKPPTPGKAPSITVPTWSKSKLGNGAELIITQKRDLPLVSFTINFVGGSYNYEPSDKVGLANFAAQMLSEGTKSRTAEQLSEAQQTLGLGIGAGVGGESGSIGFSSLKDKLEPGIALVVDMLQNSTFPAEALERIRGRTVVQLTQGRDQPNTIAANVFSRTLYGPEHPYGRFATEQTVKAVTRDDVVKFANDYFKPGRAEITVTGDVDVAATKALVEKALAGWSGGAKPAWNYPAVPAQKATTIFLVDKPKAAQSVFAIGLTGPNRYTPDWYSLQVMNMVFGGLFQSRINHNIREEKGYSYGVNSSFAYGRGPGAFRAGGGIVTAKTDSALIEFMKEFKGAQGTVPFTDDEIAQGKAALIQSLPSRWSSVGGLGASIGSIYVQDLPEAFFKTLADNINKVTRDDLVRVAKKYVDLAHLNIIIVGDRAVVEEPLKKTGIAPVVLLDVDGKPVIVP